MHAPARDWQDKSQKTTFCQFSVGRRLFFPICLAGRLEKQFVRLKGSLGDDLCCFCWAETWVFTMFLICPCSIQKLHLATWRKLRKYKLSCQAPAQKKQCKYREFCYRKQTQCKHHGFGLPKRKKHQYSIYSVFCAEGFYNVRKHGLFGNF